MNTTADIREEPWWIFVKNLIESEDNRKKFLDDWIGGLDNLRKNPEDQQGLKFVERCMSQNSEVISTKKNLAKLLDRDEKSRNMMLDAMIADLKTGPSK